MKKLGVILAAFILVSGLSYAVFAQPENEKTVTVAVKPNPKITLTTDRTAVSFGQIDPDVPTIISPAVKVEVKSNRKFTLGYRATDFSNGSESFSVSNLEYNGNGTVGSYVPFSSNGTILTDSRGVKRYTYDYRLTVPWEVSPDATYTASITYTAVQN